MKTAIRVANVPAEKFEQRRAQETCNRDTDGKKSQRRWRVERCSLKAKITQAVHNQRFALANARTNAVLD